MKKYLIILFLGLSTVNCQLSTLSAQTQPGIVRTVSRPNHPSEPLAEVMLRVRGNHNAVLSTANGEFALLMQGLQPGQEYTISSISKFGYELREPEIIGRKQAFSTTVPLEIVMISSQVLLEERQRIEAKARANVEANYTKRLAELDEALASAKLTNEAYEAQLNELEDQYERFEPLLQSMSRYYALIDYNSRDTLAERIAERIEAGDLDAAEQLIKAKGAINDREKKLRELQQLQAFMLNDLATDCYHLFTIACERLQNDSAEVYICKRALLDTTNVEYQLQAGQFLMIYRAKFDEAEAYFQRALRLAKKQFGEESRDVATALSELGENRYLQKRYDEALPYLEQAHKLTERVMGKNSLSMAQSYTNLGSLYLRTGKDKKAVEALQIALELYQANCPNSDDVRIADAYNNLGNANFQIKKYNEAEQQFMDASTRYTRLYGENHFRVAVVTNNLASISFINGNMAQAKSLFEKALVIFTRTLGPNHPRTQQTKKNLDYLKSLKK